MTRIFFCFGGASDRRTLPDLNIARASRIERDQIVAISFVAFRLVANQKLLPDLQFARVVDVIERDQIVVGNFEFLRDRDRIVAFRHDVNFFRRIGIFRFWRALCGRLSATLSSANAKVWSLAPRDIFLSD